MYDDFGLVKSGEVRMDATAGKAMTERRGLGKVRHVSTKYLWIQQRVKAKELTYPKVGTTDNQADLLTKPLADPRIQYLLSRMSMHFVEGRCSLAPVLEGTAPNQ